VLILGGHHQVPVPPSFVDALPHSRCCSLVQRGSRRARGRCAPARRYMERFSVLSRLI
jgi:hypothetical protein